MSSASALALTLIGVRAPPPISAWSLVSAFASAALVPPAGLRALPPAISNTPRLNTHSFSPHGGTAFPLTRLRYPNPRHPEVNPHTLRSRPGTPGEGAATFLD